MITLTEDAMLNLHINPTFKYLFVGTLVASLLGCAQQKNTNEIVQAPPTKITGFKSPESVVQSIDGKIYVSEINEFGKDSDGQISVIENGNVRVFADGLDDPKGLVIIADKLYVADKTRIYKISLADASQRTEFVPASAFPKSPQFLNDLEADPNGNLYVSDSGDILGTGKGGAIYKISPDGTVSTLVDGANNELVMAPNGLLADDTGKYLLFVDFTSGTLYNLNMETGEVADLEEGFGGGDGLVHHSSGTMYVSDWKGGKVYAVSRNGEINQIGPQYQAAADIAITKDEHYLMVPDMKAGELDFIDLTKQ